MSYLRGPLTRQQIKRLSPPDDDAAPAPSERAISVGGATAPERDRPVLPAGVEEAFLNDEPGTYRPHLVASVSLHYVRASQGLDAWEEHVILAPLDDEIPWDSSVLFRPDELDLGHDAPDDAAFVTPPSGSVGKGRFRTYGKQIKSHVYQSRPKTLWRCKALKLQSKPIEKYIKALIKLYPTFQQMIKESLLSDDLKEKYLALLQRRFNALSYTK